MLTPKENAFRSLLPNNFASPVQMRTTEHISDILPVQSIRKLFYSQTLVRNAHLWLRLFESQALSVTNSYIIINRHL